MEKADLSPIFVFLFYILRCLVPLGIMLGVSYLLRRLGLIQEGPPPPSDWNNGDNNEDQNQGGLTNG